MDHQLLLLEATRKNLLDLTADLSRDEWLEIPAGFKNNLLWNFGHILSAQQGLTYGCAGLPLRIPDSLRKPFVKGSAPAAWTETPDPAAVRKAMVDSLAQLREDLGAGLFRNYNPYQTSYGVLLNDIGQAVAFDVVHESLHMGVMRAMKKLVTSKRPG
jgi:hypothetical protein